MGLLALDAAARIAARRRAPRRTATWCCWKTRTARSGTGSRSPKGSALVERALACEPIRAIYAAGGDRGGARRSAQRRRHRLGPDRRACTTCWLQAAPSPVVELNRAVAVAMRDGPAAGLALIDAILARGDLANYHLAHLGAGGSVPAAGQERGGARFLPAGALRSGRQEPERRFLERRLEPGRIEPKISHEFPKWSGNMSNFGISSNDYLNV